MSGEFRLLDSGKNRADFNMALDDVLCGEVEHGLCLPVLRFYGWERDSISIGYMQDLKEIDFLKKCIEEKIDLVRRPTGGTAVFHSSLGRELTLSMIIPVHLSGETYSYLYRRVSDAVYIGLKEMGISPLLVSNPGLKEKNYNTRCFAYVSGYDILSSSGRKIFGIAQRRRRKTILLQGHISIGNEQDKLKEFFGEKGKISKEIEILDFSRKLLKKSILKGFEKVWNISFIEKNLTVDEQVLALENASKYQIREILDLTELFRKCIIS